ncbi:MAG: DUF7948 domain-containing protein, partial [Candidatus Thorarchaeota archaeon]
MKWKHTLIAISLVTMMGCAVVINIATIGGIRETSLRNPIDPNELVSTKINHALNGFFYENVGQVASSDILFIGRTSGGAVAFSENSISIVNSEDDNCFTFTFETERQVVPQGQDESEHKTNFIRGSEVRITGIRGFSTLIYDEVWPGIDVYCTATSDGTVIQFVLAPDSDPASIRITTSHTNLLSVADRSIVVHGDPANIIIDNLEGFQDQSTVSANFVEIDSDSFGINVDNGKTKTPIMIESILHSVSLGGSDFDIPFSVTLDSYGNAFVT